MPGPVNNDYTRIINDKGFGYTTPVIVGAIVNGDLDRQ